MSIINRHAGAPYKDGEVLSAGTEVSPDELELDVVRLFNEYNGGVDDSNVKAAANIQGSKIAASSIPSDRIGPAAISNAKLSKETIPAAKIKDGEVWLDKLQQNSVSSVLRGNTFSVSMTLDEYVEVMTRSIVTGNDPTSVLVMWSFSVETISDVTLGFPELIFRIERGNTTIYESTQKFIGNSTYETQCLGIVYMDSSAPAATSVPYKVSVKLTVVPRDIRIAESDLVLLNLRR